MTLKECLHRQHGNDCVGTLNDVRDHEKDLKGFGAEIRRYQNRLGQAGFGLGGFAQRDDGDA